MEYLKIKEETSIKIKVERMDKEIQKLRTLLLQLLKMQTAASTAILSRALNELSNEEDIKK